MKVSVQVKVEFRLVDEVVHLMLNGEGLCGLRAKGKTVTAHRFVLEPCANCIRKVDPA